MKEAVISLVTWDITYKLMPWRIKSSTFISDITILMLPIQLVCRSAINSPQEREIKSIFCLKLYSLFSIKWNYVIVLAIHLLWTASAACVDWMAEVTNQRSQNSMNFLIFRFDLAYTTAISFCGAFSRFWILLPLPTWQILPFIFETFYL